MEKKKKRKNWMWFFLGIIFLLIFSLSQVNYYMPAPPIDDDYLPEIINGYFMCSSPKNMEVNIPDDFEVWITRDSIRDIEFFKENLSGNDQSLIEKIRVGHIMEVKLKEIDTLAQNFSINSLNSSEQILDKYDAAVWKWRITALNEGIHYLIVIAKIKMMNQDLEVIGYKDLPIIERSIKVEVRNDVVVEEVDSNGNIDEQSRNYYWLIAIPFIGLIFWLFRRKKQEDERQQIGFEEFEQIKSSIQLFISKDKADKAFDLLEEITNKYGNKKTINELIQLKSNYTNNKSRYNRNLISNDEFNLSRSKVINEILEMMNKFNVKKGETQK